LLFAPDTKCIWYGNFSDRSICQCYNCLL